MPTVLFHNKILQKGSKAKNDTLNLASDVI